MHNGASRTEKAKSQRYQSTATVRLYLFDCCAELASHKYKVLLEFVKVLA